MPSKWFCKNCGMEIWKELSDGQKKTESVYSMEQRCVCADCMLKEAREWNPNNVGG